MVGTPAIRNLIREDKVAQMFSVIQTGAANGMQTMEQHARLLLSQGLIDIEEVSKKVVQNDNLFQ
jgi:twitching motility protein PilT